MPDRLVQFLFRHRVFVLAWVAAMTLLMGWQASQLKTDFDIEQFLPAQDEGRLYFEEFKGRFDVTDRDIMVILTDDALFSAETLRDIRALTGELERIRGIEEVISITNADDVTGTADSLEVRPMVDEIPATQAERDAVRDRILANGLYVERILSRDGRSTCLLAKIDWAYHAGSVHRGDGVYGGRFVTDGIEDASTERERICSAIEATIAKYRTGGRTFHLGGVPFVRRDYVVLINGDAAVFFPLALALATVVLIFIFRNFHGVLLTLGVTVSAVIWTLGLMSLTGARLNFLANMMPVLVTVAGTSDSLHILLHYYEEYGRVQDKAKALRRTVKELSFACFLTSFTTALGFLTLRTSKITLIQEFGVFTGVGILFAFVISILTIPTVLSWLPPPPPRHQQAFESGWLARLLGGLPGWVARRRRWVGAALASLVLASGFAFSQVPEESLLLEDVHRGHPIIQTNNFIEEHFGGILAVEMVFDSGREDGVKDPAFLRRLEAVQDWAEAQPDLQKVLSIVDFVEDLHMSFRGEDPAFRRIPETAEEVAQLLLLYSFSDREPLKGFLSYDYRYARVSAKIRDFGTRATLGAVERLRRRADEVWGGPAPLRMTGLTYLAQDVNAYIVGDMSTSFILDLLIICVLFYAVTGTLRLSIAGIVPNLLPLGCTFLIMWLGGITLKPSTAIIFSVVFGIAVDDSLHFLARFREEWAQTAGDTLEATRRTLLGTGRATVFFSVLLTTGFAILTMSAFQGNQLFALLCGSTIMTGLIGELFLMPWCLTVLKPAWRRAGTCGGAPAPAAQEAP